MLQTLQKALFEPLLQRVGTAVGVWLIAQGVGEPLATQVATGVIAAGLIAAEFAIRWWLKRNEAAKQPRLPGL